jgi:signal peptidase I
MESYIVPTGSMERTIMTGDFLIGNRFVYGMRTPDWLGIIWTDIGFDIPYVRFPAFKKPGQGDVIIFKYPRDTHQKYVKRLIAGPGDSLEIKSKKVYVNGDEFILPKHGRFQMPLISKSYSQPDIFLANGSNKDHYPTIRIPAKGDRIPINNETNWRYLLPLMMMEGHTAELNKGTVNYQFDLTDPYDLRRRGKKENVLRQYREFDENGTKLNPWSGVLTHSDFQYLVIDGKPIQELSEYVLTEDYYWAMGDNRDDSLDSRYWGFVPHKYILGEALFVFMSLDLDSWIPRLNRIGTVIR